MIHFELTQYGFDYGAAKVTRIFSDEKRGTVTIGIETPKHKGRPMQVYVTKTGKVRVFHGGIEWKPVDAGRE